ncbi:glycoside hydrolase family 105 protein [Providencia rettgeri]|uniref:Glycoside hydrolase family 105 protein n=2 Tax=Providencia rettgeri TaxID=587 RepID=A0AAP2K157_PRORE|nr:glycoside hydrolase family 88 protein [Providencia rettgeri]EJD6399137.1 glycoside hydrolase family 88 protein [Providencia rettgeri]MBX6955868.1 glycoside hydrolase family 105 protein [Providencia rettgeri]MBX6959434.1 glycoside hydrolase family 105 protein [Providencia rettgeri]MBX6970407.1 glycoside hydrolase family 105 protein [Providencia rettgeri]MBX6981833.1 glycoside hydrolase family 105 protein [Providencia rettgeri]
MEQSLLPQSLQRNTVLQDMKRVYRFQSANQVRSVIRRSGKTRFIKDTDWERGVLWSCVAAAWQATQDKEYLDGVMNYTLHTGFRPGPNARFADDHVCTQAYLVASSQFLQPEVLEPTIKAFDLMLAEPKAGREDWWWCDALFMAPPAFAALSAKIKDVRYLNYMNQAYWDAIEHLRDIETGLVYRDYRYIPDGQGSELREANGEKVFWSRGIGWVIASIPRILPHLPSDHPDRQRYIDLFTELLAAIIPYQQEDGFWRTSLLDPQSFPAPESSAAALFCYGIAWGINHNILDEKIFYPVLEKAWVALRGCIHPNGMLGYVQLPAFNPRDVNFEHNMDYGAGAYLLAGSEVINLFC